jgi:hypothetical protein
MNKRAKRKRDSFIIRRPEAHFGKESPRIATVTFESDQSASGWHAPATAPWLKSVVDAAEVRRHRIRC